MVIQKDDETETEQHTLFEKLIINKKQREDLMKTLAELAEAGQAQAEGVEEQNDTGNETE